jgi:hypothetical protein
MHIAPSTRLLIQKRNKLRALWQSTHNIALCHRINALKQQIRTAIKINYVSPGKDTPAIFGTRGGSQDS